MKKQVDQNADRLADLERVMRRMSNFDRQVFLAVRLDDLSCAEIAHRTRTSVAAVEQAFLRAMRTIDRELSRPRPRPRRRWWFWPF